MLKVVHDESEPNAIGGAGGLLMSSLLDEIVRDGARQMLAAALRAEVAAYIEAHRDEVDEHSRAADRELMTQLNTRRETELHGSCSTSLKRQ